MSYKAQLEIFDACAEGIEWAGDKTLEQIWAECPRIDWLLWLAGKLEIDHKKIVRVACGCARLALPYVAAGELRSLAAIELAERWAAGDESISIVMLRDAADAVARAAARAAFYAAFYEADAVARAAANAVAYAAEAETKTKCLEIFREHITLQDFIDADKKIKGE